MDNTPPKLKLFHADLSKVTKIAEPLLPESTRWVCYGTTTNWLEAALTGEDEEKKLHADNCLSIHQKAGLKIPDEKTSVRNKIKFS